MLDKRQKESLGVNLLPAIGLIEKEKRNIMQKYKKEIDKLETAFTSILIFCSKCSACGEQVKADCDCCRGIGYIVNPEYAINVLDALTGIKNRVNRLKEQCDVEIMILDKGLDLLRKQNTTCECCSGNGKVNRPRPTAECDRELMTCPRCKGSGREPDSVG